MFQQKTIWVAVVIWDGTKQSQSWSSSQLNKNQHYAVLCIYLLHLLFDLHFFFSTSMNIYLLQPEELEIGLLVTELDSQSLIFETILKSNFTA